MQTSEQYRNITKAKNKQRYNRFQPSPDTDIAKYSFFPRTIVDWNYLDNNIVSQESLEGFKSELEKARD